MILQIFLEVDERWESRFCSERPFAEDLVALVKTSLIKCE